MEKNKKAVKKNCIKKENSTLLYVLVGVVLSVLAAVAGAVVWCFHRQMKRMKSREGSNNMMHGVILGAQKVNVGEKTENAFLTCVAGVMTVDLTKEPLEHNINVEVICVAGKVDITIPEGVKVLCDGIDEPDQFDITTADCTEDEVITIRISETCVCGKIIIHNA